MVPSRTVGASASVIFLAPFNYLEEDGIQE